MAIELLTLDTVQNKLRSVQAGDVINVPATLNVNALNVNGVPITGGIPQHTHVSADITDAVGPAGGKLLRTDVLGKVALANLPSIPPNQLADAAGVIPAANFNAAGGIPLLDATGKIPAGMLPALQAGAQLVSYGFFPIPDFTGAATNRSNPVANVKRIFAPAFYTYSNTWVSNGWYDGIGVDNGLGPNATTPTTTSVVFTVPAGKTGYLFIDLAYDGAFYGARAVDGNGNPIVAGAYASQAAAHSLYIRLTAPPSVVVTENLDTSPSYIRHRRVYPTANTGLNIIGGSLVNGFGATSSWNYSNYMGAWLGTYWIEFLFDIVGVVVLDNTGGTAPQNVTLSFEFLISMGGTYPAGGATAQYFDFSYNVTRNFYHFWVQ